MAKVRNIVNAKEFRVVGDGHTNMLVHGDDGQYYTLYMGFLVEALHSGADIVDSILQCTAMKGFWSYKTIGNRSFVERGLYEKQIDEWKRANPDKWISSSPYWMHLDKKLQFNAGGR